MSSSLFEFSGFAAKTDLEKQEWRDIFQNLEKIQGEFLERQDEFRSREYRWPRDPLHTWSRLWEYPYVYHQIQRVLTSRPAEKLRVLDYGSGVTFFSFAVARLGCDVICADIDPVVQADIPEAVKHVKCTPGKVDAALVKDGCIPVDSGTQDIVYCISVLEHISSLEAVIDEIARVLKPGGQLILTVDIDLEGKIELSANEFEKLQNWLDKHFLKKLPERALHPSCLLTSTNSYYSMERWSLFSATVEFIKNLLRGKVFIAHRFDSPYLAIYSGVFVMRNTR